MRTVSQEDLRLAAALALGEARAASAAHELVGLLRDRSLRVRAVTAFALGQLGNPLAIGPLLDTLNDPTNLKEEAEVPEEYWCRQPEKDVYSSVQNALKHFGADAVLASGQTPILVQMLQAGLPQLVRIDATGTLGWLGAEAKTQTAIRDEVVVPALASVLEDDDEYVRDFATRSLQRIESEQAHAALQKRRIRLPPS